MTVEDREGVLFVDGVAVEEEPEPEEAKPKPGANLAGAKKSSKKRKKKTQAEESAEVPQPVAAPPAAPTLSGSLDSLPVADLLLLLVESQRSGSFTVQSPDGSTAKLFIGGGGIFGCRHPMPGVNIGTFLLNGGFINQQQLDATLAAVTASAAAGVPKMLLSTLIETGALAEAAAPTAVAQYVDNTIAQVLSWTAGTFSFEPNINVVGDADRVDPQAAFVATQLAASDYLKSAAPFMSRPPAPAPEPQPAPARVEAPAEPAPSGLAALGAKKWALAAVPAILLGLGIGGIIASGYASERDECASARDECATTLASAKAELAKPADCPECPPCETAVASEATDEASADEAEDRPKKRKPKRKRKKGGGKAKPEDDGTPDISHLLDD